MSSQVRCTSCHRVEDWTASPGGFDRRVRAPGGHRRAEAPGHRALEVVLAEPGRVVAACPACGQPMVGDGPPPIGWLFPTPEGPVTLAPDGTAAGPDGAPMPRDAAIARIRAAHPAAPPAPDSRWTVALQLGLLALMVTPIAVWLFSVLYVTFFLSHAGDAL